MLEKNIINLKDFVFVTSNAEAYYSGATVSEFAVIHKDLFNANKEALDKFYMSYCELDGKHSETEAYIEFKVDPNTTEMIQIIDGYNDVSILIDMLSDLLKIEGKELYNLKNEVIAKVQELNQELSTDDLILIEKVKFLNNNVINELINNKKVMAYFLNLKQ